jgi:acyl carrier protein
VGFIVRQPEEFRLSKRPINEWSEWKGIRSILAEKADLNQRQLQEIGEIEADSLDFVEVVMAFEDKYKIKIPL